MNKISVAVVDDNEKIVETICNELERDEEINIVGKAKNGEEAFDIIKKTNPDVVVLDLIMPKMDGLSLMNKIHKDGSIIKLPFFIITSAISNETVIQDAFGYGAGYYMLKPFETEMIVERVKTAKSYNKRLPDNKKFVAAYEDKKKFMDRNIESDVTNIIHDVGVPAHIKGYHTLILMPDVYHAVKLFLFGRNSKMAEQFFPVSFQISKCLVCFFCCVEFF